MVGLNILPCVHGFRTEVDCGCLTNGGPEDVAGGAGDVEGGTDDIKGDTDGAVGGVRRTGDTDRSYKNT